MHAGLQLLERLLEWPALLLPMTSALCAVLRDLLEDAALRDSTAAQDRMFIYRVVRNAMSTLGPPVISAVAEGVLKCAWGEFYVDSLKPIGAAAVTKLSAGPRKKARRQAAAAELELYQQSDALAAAEFAQRPAAVDNVAAAQVHSPSLYGLCFGNLNFAATHARPAVGSRWLDRGRSEKEGGCR
jgi:hypothetical protein